MQKRTSIQNPKNKETHHQPKKASAAFKLSKVAILGRPNAGKSTLLNALIESELSATSNRPQTTRRKISGVIQRFTGKKWTGQLVLMDTPGINFQKGALERSFLNAVEEGLQEANVLLWIADARTFEKDLNDLEMDKVQEDRVANWLQHQMKITADMPQKWILVLNKADMLSKGELLPLIEKALKVLPRFCEVVPVSSIKGLASKDSNLNELLNVLDNYSHQADPIFDEDTFTDVSKRELLREFVREALFRTCKKEVPYQSDCQVLEWKEAPRKGLKTEVHAVIWASKPSLKGILVGSQGSKIKEIGMSARARYEEVTGEEIILKLFVKVVDRWERRSQTLGELGYSLS
jgi:GTP-binding protein Era